MGRYSRYFLEALLVAAFALGLNSTHAFASGSVVPPAQRSFQMSYGEWSARWWQFVFGLPEADNPLNDTTGALCGKAQWGPVIFLYGTTGGDPVVRTCTIPGNKGLLIPIVNFGGSVPEDGTTIEEVAGVAQGAADLIDVSTLVFTIDGIPVGNLGKYRFQSPVFSYTGSIPNVFSEIGCVATSPHCYEGFHDQALADGYWVLVNPLPPGHHTIHVHGEVPDWDFVVDVTYHLTVLPGRPAFPALQRGIGR
jgi:hypothetical protein